MTVLEDDAVMLDSGIRQVVRPGLQRVAVRGREGDVVERLADSILTNWLGPRRAA